MVKKNSSLLEKTVVDEQEDTDVEMNESFWHGVLDLYFIRGKESRKRQDDDLVFFVRKLVYLLQFHNYFPHLFHFYLFIYFSFGDT